MSSNLGKTQAMRFAQLAAAVALVAAVSGCSLRRDSVTVGSIPDDVRTNHPITISEREEVLDVPVGAGDRELTTASRQTVEGFADGWREAGSGVMRVMLPSGSPNAAAAARLRDDIVAALRTGGVAAGSISVEHYSAGAQGDAAPIRLSYTGLSARTEQCGRWPKDMLESAENRHYANFGCATQNNLAAQIAHPGDLVGPRKRGEIDATQRGRIIEEYQNGPQQVAGEVDY
ncbi:MAG TPA: CpaD family pilus assembly lipoprotein [Rhizobiaceae bacterium]|nr:CpaD family pilus assembly lipoprotein [Rhizobiaceae bacterium]